MKSRILLVPSSGDPLHCTIIHWDFAGTEQERDQYWRGGGCINYKMYRAVRVDFRWKVGLFFILVIPIHGRMEWDLSIYNMPLLSRSRYGYCLKAICIWVAPGREVVVNVTCHCALWSHSRYDCFREVQGGKFHMRGCIREVDSPSTLSLSLNMCFLDMIAGLHWESCLSLLEVGLCLAEV